MGATNSTTNYNLSQFIGTDKPAWLQDYNGDMLKIDTAINNAKTAADNAANAASAAQGDASTALGDISSINTTVGNISNTLNTAVGNINTINSLIGNGTPTTTDQTIIGAINELDGEILRQKVFSYVPTVADVTLADALNSASAALMAELSALSPSQYSLVILDVVGSSVIYGTFAARDEYYRSAIPSSSTFQRVWTNGTAANLTAIRVSDNSNVATFDFVAASGSDLSSQTNDITEIKITYRYIK